MEVKVSKSAEDRARKHGEISHILGGMAAGGAAVVAVNLVDLFLDFQPQVNAVGALISILLILIFAKISGREERLESEALEEAFREKYHIQEPEPQGGAT